MRKDRKADMNKYLEAGKVRNTHGVKGALKVEHWCDDASVFTSLKDIYIKNGELYKSYRVSSASSAGNGVIILKLDGIDTFEDAAKLKNSVLYASRDQLPEADDRVFIADIIGLPVKDADTGVLYGTLTDVTSNGPQELFEIKTENGLRYVPAVKQFVKRIELSEAVFITPIPGLLED